MKVVIVGLGYANYEPERAATARVGAELVLADPKDKAQVIELCKDAAAIAVRQIVIDKEVIGAMRCCKLIARYGIGCDNVDLQAAAEKGIYVCNVTTYCLHDVSEHAFALLMCAGREVVRHNRALLAGRWDINSEAPLHRMHGRTLGLVGFGQIPRHLAKKVKGLEFRILAYDPYVKAEDMRALGAEKAELEQVLRESDYISLHAAVTPETTHMIGEKQLSMMKKTAILVNTSRGALIDEKALAAAMKAKKIACAALDVFEKEPLQADSPLRGLDNVILTDHAAWYTEESIVELQQGVADLIEKTLKGETPPNIVNKKFMK